MLHQKQPRIGFRNEENVKQPQFWHDHYKFDSLIQTVLKMLHSYLPSLMCSITHEPHQPCTISHMCPIIHVIHLNLHSIKQDMCNQYMSHVHIDPITPFTPTPPNPGPLKIAKARGSGLVRGGNKWSYGLWAETILSPLIRLGLQLQTWSRGERECKVRGVHTHPWPLPTPLACCVSLDTPVYPWHPSHLLHVSIPWCVVNPTVAGNFFFILKKIDCFQ